MMRSTRTIDLASCCVPISVNVSWPMKKEEKVMSFFKSNNDWLGLVWFDSVCALVHPSCHAVSNLVSLKKVIPTMCYAHVYYIG